MSYRSSSIRSVVFPEINGRTTPFKVIARLPYPTVIAIKGISGAETIALESFVGDSNTDDLKDDANWVAAFFNGNALQFNLTQNTVLIEGGGIYRLNMTATPAAAITACSYEYGA